MTRESEGAASLYAALEGCCRSWEPCPQGDGLSARGTFVFPPEYPGFGGHFPGRPVLPAVAQLGAVRYLVARLLQREVRPLEYRRIKFRGMVVPDEAVSVGVRLSYGEGGWSAEFEIVKVGGVQVSSGTALFASTEF